MGIIKTIEHTAVPCYEIVSMMGVQDDRQLALSIEPGTLASKYINFEKQKIRGGGYLDCIVPTNIVGLVPLNALVSLWVEPKVPVGNLDHIVKTYGGIVPDNFKCLRTYMQSDLASDELQSYIVASFLRCANEIRRTGLLRQYIRIEDDGGSLSGHIDFRRSASTFFSRGIGYRVVSSRFERSALIEPNICIKYALDYLIATGESCSTFLPDIYDIAAFFETYAGIKNISVRPSFEISHMGIPATRPAYLDAIVLAQTLTSGQSPDLSTYAGDLRMSNLAIDMSSAFESYMRTILMNADGCSWVALDGNNLDPPIYLYESRKLSENLHDAVFDASSTTDGIDIDPDILIRLPHGGFLVADAKYKPVRGPLSAQRQDVQQVVTYATRLGSLCALTVHPCDDGQLPGLRYSGSIGPVDVYCYLFDLASENMAAGECAFIDAVNLLAMHYDSAA